MNLLPVFMSKTSSVIYTFTLFSLSVMALVNRLEGNIPRLYSHSDEKLLSAAQRRKITTKTTATRKHLCVHCTVQRTKNESGFVEDELVFSQLAPHGRE